MTISLTYIYTYTFFVVLWNKSPDICYSLFWNVCEIETYWLGSLIICQDNFVVVFLYLKCFYTMSLSNSLKYTCRELQSQLKLIVLFLLLCSGGSLDFVKTFDDIEKFRVATGASSVMLARAAMWNPSIFRQQGALSVETVMDKYIQYVSGTQFTKIPTVTNSEQQKMSCHYFFYATSWKIWIYFFGFTGRSLWQ